MGGLLVGCSGSIEPESGTPASLSGVTHAVTFKTSLRSNYVVAENGGGGVVNANRPAASTWETFQLGDLNGGTLESGDLISLAASNGQFLSAANGGGSSLSADRPQVLDWEIFRIAKIGGSGTIANGDSISLQTKVKGNFLSALDGGGSSLVADRSAVGGWESFVIGITDAGDGGVIPGAGVSWWLTTADGAQGLAPQAAISLVSGAGSDPTTVRIDTSRRYQQMFGFGASLTDSSAWLLDHISPSQRAAAMTALFDRNQGIGVNLLRQPMGASDLAWSFYSYDDVPAGQSDPTLASFSIDRDRPYIIPMVRQALQVNPALAVIATPWSAPAWMKTNGSLSNTGELIDPTSYPAYAQYFVKFVQQYEAAGIPIFAVTTINEPLIQPVGYPSMSMQWWQQSNFVRYHLGPAFKAANISSRILLFDHNWDNASYPKQILDDNAEVRGYSGGVAFHCYGGQPDAMDAVHDAHPTQDIYVTECSGGTWSGSFGDSLKSQFQNLYIGAARHWARSVVRWNLALDDRHGPLPAAGGGCTTCIGLITVHDDGSFTKEVDYYAMGHASRFLQPGATRVDSNTFGNGSIEDVSFVNPDGSRVLLVLNSANGERSFTVVEGTRSFSARLPAGATATFTWR